MKRKISLWLVLLFVWISIGVVMLFGWSVYHICYEGTRYSKYGNLIISIAKFPSLVRDAYTLFGRNQLLLDDKYPNLKAIRLKHSISDDGYLLLSSYDNNYNQSTVTLLKLSDSKIIHTWVLDLDNKKIKIDFLDRLRKNEFRMFHPLLLEDGSIIFHNGGSPLISLDIHSNIKWILKGIFHHSLELDADGNIWVPTRIDSSDVKSQILKLFDNDAIGKVSVNGKLIFQKSIAEILLENGYKGLLFGVGPFINDPVHLNDIQPALTTTNFWQKGDLLVSLRNLSSVLLYRPTTNKIIWLKTGPWLNQHDVDFVDSRKIGVFGNDVIRSSLNSTHRPDFLINGYNDEYIYNFATNKISTPYTDFFSKFKVSTLTEGRSDVLENGDLFVEESNNGRLFRVNTKNAIWSFVDRINGEKISIFSWSRYISKKEFDKCYAKINFNQK